jgi:hypothetical protein
MPTSPAPSRAELPWEWDAGVVKRSGPLTLSADTYLADPSLPRHRPIRRRADLRPVQLGAANYGRGHLWGAEFAARYRTADFTAYASLSFGRNEQKGVATGQFDFDPVELAFIDSHFIVLDHQPLAGGAAGAS